MQNNGKFNYENFSLENKLLFAEIWNRKENKAAGLENREKMELLFICCAQKKLGFSMETNFFKEIIALSALYFT